MAAGQAIHGSDVADGRMEPDVIVMVDKITYNALSIFECKRGFRPDSLFFKGAVITFQFAIGTGRELHPMQSMQNNISG